MDYRVAVVHGANPKQAHAQNRAHGGADLYKEGKAHVVVTTGRHEADDLAQIVFKDGVPENAIRTETKSKTTWENLKNLAADIFPQLEDANHSFELAYLISQEWHRDRLLYVAWHALGDRYPHRFYAVPDGRNGQEIDADARLENYKMLVEKVTLPIPFMGGSFNSSAYWILSKMRR